MKEHELSLHDCPINSISLISEHESIVIELETYDEELEDLVPLTLTFKDVKRINWSEMGCLNDLDIYSFKTGPKLPQASTLVVR